MSGKPSWRAKRIYEDPEKSDGYRVLVDRLWPRGIRKADASLDDWAKDTAPSTALRKWFHEDPEGRWEEFRQRFRQELDANPASADLVKLLESEPIVTLITASKNLERSQVPVLREWLDEHMSS